MCIRIIVLTEMITHVFKFIYYIAITIILLCYIINYYNAAAAEAAAAATAAVTAILVFFSKNCLFYIFMIIHKNKQVYNFTHYTCMFIVCTLRFMVQSFS